MGKAVIGGGVAALVDGEVPIGAALIGAGVAYIGARVAILADRVLLSAAVIGLGIAVIGGGVAVVDREVLFDRRSSAPGWRSSGAGSCLPAVLLPSGLMLVDSATKAPQGRRGARRGHRPGWPRVPELHEPVPGHPTWRPVSTGGPRGRCPGFLPPLPGDSSR